MLAFWLAVSSLQLLRNRPAVWPLLLAGLIVVAKGTTLDPKLLLWGIPVAATLLFRRFSRETPEAACLPMVAAPLLCSWASWLAIALDWNHSAPITRSTAPHQTTSIVCIGDSLTLYEERTGGYPEVLERLLERRVINLGQPGITTQEALPKFRQVSEIAPAFVVIELGGHDFLKGLPRTTARKNIEGMIVSAREAGATVILMEIPRGFIFDPWWGLERQIAREQNVTLLPDSVIRMFVLNSPFAPPGMWTNGPFLSDDGLHPNANGNLGLARSVARAVKSLEH
jgi:lysophospholipase L1-like esterase